MGLINTAAAWPGDDMNPDTIEADAKKLATMGTSVARHGASIATTWHGLRASYEAPEDEELFNAIIPVKKDAESFHTEMYWVGNALTQFAHEVRVIKQQVAQIRARATTFLAGISNGQVTPKSSGYNPYGGGTLSDPKPVAWADDDTTRNANNALIAEVDHWTEVLAAAETSCASSIARQIPGSGGSRSQPPKGSSSWYGWSAPSTQPTQSSAEPSPWGEPTQKQESTLDLIAWAAGQSAKAYYVHFLWKGVVLGTGGGMLRGLWGLEGWDTSAGWDHIDQWHRSAKTAAQSWEGLVRSTFNTSLPGITLELGLAAVGVAGDKPAWNAAKKNFEFQLGGTEGLIAFDEWRTDPLAAAGETAGNIGSFFIPVGGEVAGGAKAASEAAEMGALAGRTTEGVEVASRAGEAAAGAAEATAEGSATARLLAKESHTGEVGEALVRELAPEGIPGIEIGEAAGEEATATAPEFADLTQSFPAGATGAPFRLTTDIKIDPPLVADSGIDMSHSSNQHHAEASANPAPSPRRHPEPARSSSSTSETPHASMHTDTVLQRQPALAGTGGRGGHSEGLTGDAGDPTGDMTSSDEPARGDHGTTTSPGEERSSQDGGGPVHDDVPGPDDEPRPGRDHHDDTHHDVTHHDQSQHGDQTSHDDQTQQNVQTPSSSHPVISTDTSQVHQKVWTVLERVTDKKSPFPHYVGGREWENNLNQLPTRPARTYQEWDVNARVKGVGRGPERIVTNLDGSAYYTTDHYHTFIQLRGPRE